MASARQTVKNCKTNSYKYTGNKYIYFWGWGGDILVDIVNDSDSYCAVSISVYTTRVLKSLNQGSNQPGTQR